MELVPMVYEHAACLIGERPAVVSRDAALLAAAHIEAYRQYHHAPVVVGIDLYNIEPEAYGALVTCPDGLEVPSITAPFCTTLDDLLALPPMDPTDDGRLPLVLNAARRIAAAYPQADIRVPVSGPVAIAANLLGLESLLCALLEDIERATAAFAHLALGQGRWCRAILHAGFLPIIFDSAASPPLLAPAVFRQAVLPALRLMLSDIASAGGPPPWVIIGGDAARIVDDLLALGSGGLLCPAETDGETFLAGILDMPVRLNMRAGIIASSDPEEVKQEIFRLCRMAAGRAHACLGTGIIPCAMPAEKIIYWRNFVENLEIDERVIHNCG